MKLVLISQGGWNKCIETSEGFIFRHFKGDKDFYPHNKVHTQGKLDSLGLVRKTVLKALNPVNLEQKWEDFCKERRDEPKYDLRKLAKRAITHRDIGKGGIVRATVLGKDSVFGIEAMYLNDDGAPTALLGLDIGIENIYSHPLTKQNRTLMYECPMNEVRCPPTGLQYDPELFELIDSPDVD